MSRTWKWLAALGVAVVVVIVIHACSGSGPGADLDGDGLTDSTEDKNNNFVFDPGESDFFTADTDNDTLCDGQPPSPLPECHGCEDCNNNGFWEPCLGETDPLNNDTDNDGIPDGEDPAPLDHLTIDCSQGNVPMAYGASLPPGKGFPVRPTQTPTPAPFPTSTPVPGFTAIPAATFTPG
jgi:hypothetical protein